MSLGYAIDYYGVATYGYSQPTDYSVAPFTATQTNYGELTLNWKSANSKPWKQMQLVRSLYGYPSSAVDGTAVANFVPTATFTSHTDSNLLTGRIYYYTMFLTLESPTWNSGTTYSTGTIVVLNGNYWISLQNSNLNNTPAVGSAFWASTTYVPTWLPAGYVASLVVNDYGYSSYLYERTPQPYKITSTDIFTSVDIDNPALYNYLSVFGFILDMTKTEYDFYLESNNPDIVASANLDWLGAELGIRTDYLVSPQLRRNRISNAAVNYRLKGTAQGIHNAIAAISGWDSVVNGSKNMTLNIDQSYLGHPIYSAWDATTSYQTNQLVQFNGFNYRALMTTYGAAQAPTGTSSANTWWTPLISTTTTPIYDTTTLADPRYLSTPPGVYGTWAPNSGSLSSTVLLGVELHLPHPTNANIKNWTAFGFRANVNSVTLSMSTPFQGQSPTWSNAVNYVLNNYVSIITGPNVNIWKCVKPSGPGTVYGPITPGTDERFWLPIAQNEPSDIQARTQFIPLVNTRHWDNNTQYTKDTRVEYFGIVYQAVRDNIGSAPSGYYYSNSNWIYIQPAEFTNTISAYHTRSTTNATAVTPLSEMRFVTPLTGFLPGSLGSGFVTNATNTYLDRFINDYPDLNGVDDSTLAYLARPWAATANLWTTTYGMAAVNQTTAGTTTYNTARVAFGFANASLALTFVTDYIDPVHYGHGILFRYSDASNFWYATRKSLYKVVAGVETLVATFTSPFVNGDRMMVTTNGNNIFVAKYQRTGSLQDPPTNVLPVSPVVDAALAANTIHGLIQKYSASGAV